MATIGHRPVSNNIYIDSLIIPLFFVEGAGYGGRYWVDSDGTPTTHITYFMANDYGAAWLPHEVAFFEAALRAWESVADIKFDRVYSAAEATLVESKISNAALNALMGGPPSGGGNWGGRHGAPNPTASGRLSPLA